MSNSITEETKYTIIDGSNGLAIAAEGLKRSDTRACGV